MINYIKALPLKGIFGTVILLVLCFIWLGLAMQSHTSIHQMVEKSLGLGIAEAATIRSGSLHATVKASVGEYYLDITGFASPYASIILTVDGTVYRTSVADDKGDFSITGVLIRKGFSSFCLEHLDFKRIGESEACFTVPPATGSISKKDVFLPPTIGLERTEIAAGSDAVVFGYTMPGATVTIHSKDGKTYLVQADDTGYYTLTLKNLPAGTYELYATAMYHQKPSEVPSKTVKLIALSWWQQFLEWLKRLITSIIDRFTSLGLGPLWLVFPLIPLITWLILRIWPERFTIITDSRYFSFLFGRKKKKLHHAWFMGY